MWVFFATASYPFLHHAQHTSEDKFVQIDLLCLCTAHMLRQRLDCTPYSPVLLIFHLPKATLPIQQI